MKSMLLIKLCHPSSILIEILMIEWGLKKNSTKSHNHTSICLILLEDMNTTWWQAQHILLKMLREFLIDFMKIGESATKSKNCFSTNTILIRERVIMKSWVWEEMHLWMRLNKLIKPLLWSITQEVILETKRLKNNFWQYQTLLPISSTPIEGPFTTFHWLVKSNLTLLIISIEGTTQLSRTRGDNLPIFSRKQNLLSHTPSLHTLRKLHKE